MPYGDYDDHVINAVRSLGMEPIQWSIDSLDWKESSTAASILEQVTSRAAPGGIILCHNDAKYTPDALEEIFENVDRRRVYFVPISEPLLTGSYTIDHAGMQCPA